MGPLKIMEYNWRRSLSTFRRHNIATNDKPMPKLSSTFGGLFGVALNGCVSRFNGTDSEDKNHWKLARAARSSSDSVCGTGVDDLYLKKENLI